MVSRESKAKPMSDDIVIRIGEHLRGDMKKTSEFLLALASNEIERLREEVNTWRKIAELFAESHPSFDAFHSYFKEVRNG